MVIAAVLVQPCSLILHAWPILTVCSSIKAPVLQEDVACDPHKKGLYQILTSVMISSSHADEAAAFAAGKDINQKFDNGGIGKRLS